MKTADRLNAYQRIKVSQAAKDETVLIMIKRTINEYGVYRPFLPSVAWRNSITRLEGSGVIKYSQKKMGYVLAAKS